MPKFFHRTLFAAVALMLLLPAAGKAQEQDKDQGQNNQSQGGGRFAGAQRQRQHMAMLAEKLNLTDAQKQQFQQIGKDMRKQGMAIRQDSSLNADQKREKMLTLRKQAHQQMFGVLTPEQKDKLKEMREQHKKEQGKEKPSADQASAKAKAGSAESEDDDPFAGMTSDDDNGPGSDGRF
jgi:Spy/CpxP family protein refolding chaperone